jgi:hypothetical protein
LLRDDADADASYYFADITLRRLRCRHYAIDAMLRDDGHYAMLLKIRCQIATILYMLLHIAAIAAAFRRAFEDRYFAISPLHTLALR